MKWLFFKFTVCKTLLLCDLGAFDHYIGITVCNYGNLTRPDLKSSNTKGVAKGDVEVLD